MSAFDPLQTFCFQGILAHVKRPDIVAAVGLAFGTVAISSCSFSSKFSAEAVFPEGPARSIAVLAEHNNLPITLPRQLRLGINFVGRYDLTPLLWAVENDRVLPGTIGALVRNGGDAFYWSKTQRTSAILHAVTYGPPEELAEIARNVPNIDQKQGPQLRDEPTILFSAVKSGVVSQVKILMAAGANIEARNDLGETPLLYARIGQLDVMMALLSAGANPHVRDKRGAGVCEVLSDIIAPSRQPEVKVVKRQLLSEGVDCGRGDKGAA